MTRDGHRPWRQIWPDLTVLIILAVLVSTLMYHTGQEPFGNRFDGADYGSIARNLLRGKGLRSDIIYPLSFAFPPLRQAPQPLIHRDPLYPIALAGFFSVTSISDEAIKILGIIFFILTIPVVYFFTLGYFNRAVAFLTSLFTLLNPRLFLAAVDYHSEPMVCFLFALLTLFLFRLSRRKTLYTLIGGVIFGLLFLTRNYFLLTLPAVLFFIWRQDKKLIFLFLIMFCLVISPWLWKKYLLTGDPLFMLQHYSVTADMVLGLSDVYYKLTPMPLSYIIEHDKQQLVNSLFPSLLNQLGKIPTLINPLLFLLVFYPKRGALDKNVTYFLSLLFLVILPMFTLFNSRFPLYYFFIPLLTMAGTAKFMELFPLEKKLRNISAWAILGITCLFYAGFYFNYQYQYNQKWNDYEDKRPAAYAGIDKAIKKEKLVVVDDAYSYIWYADQAALILPADLETLKECHKYVPFNSLMLFMRKPLSLGYLELFRDLASYQPENISISSPGPGRYVIHWQTFPWDYPIPPADKPSLF